MHYIPTTKRNEYLHGKAPERDIKTQTKMCKNKSRMAIGHISNFLR